MGNVSRDRETLTKHMIEVFLVIGKCDNCVVQMERYTDPEPEIGGKMKSNEKRFDVMIESPTFRMIIEFKYKSSKKSFQKSDFYQLIRKSFPLSGKRNGDRKMIKFFRKFR